MGLPPPRCPQHRGQARGPRKRRMRAASCRWVLCWGRLAQSGDEGASPQQAATRCLEQGEEPAAGTKGAIQQSCCTAKELPSCRGFAGVPAAQSCHGGARQWCTGERGPSTAAKRPLTSLSGGFEREPGAVMPMGWLAGIRVEGTSPPAARDDSLGLWLPSLLRSCMGGTAAAPCMDGV